MTRTRFSLGLAALSIAVHGNMGCRSAGLSCQIETLMNDQTAQWNRGSIDGFMRYYVHGDELTFSSGGEVRRGWDETIARYEQRYPDRTAMGTLSESGNSTPRGGWMVMRVTAGTGRSFVVQRAKAVTPTATTRAPAHATRSCFRSAPGGRALKSSALSPALSIHDRRGLASGQAPEHPTTADHRPEAFPVDYRQS